jgi:hypothetical protein
LGSGNGSVKGPNGEAIRFGDAVEIIAANHTAGTWHVFNNDSGFPRDMLRKVSGEKPSHAIISSTRWKSHKNPKDFPLVIRCTREFFRRDENRKDE